MVKLHFFQVTNFYFILVTVLAFMAGFSWLHLIRGVNFLLSKHWDQVFCNLNQFIFGIASITVYFIVYNIKKAKQ